MSEEILAPLAGKIIKMHINPGSSIEEDDEIFVIEAMKMETPVYAPCNGKIASINVNEGDDVDEDDLIALIE